MGIPLYGQNKDGNVLGNVADGKIRGIKEVNASTTLSKEDAGKLIVIGTAAIEVTLPSAEAGMTFEFCLKVESTAGTTIVASSGDCFFGTVKVFSTTADQGAVMQSIDHATAIATVASYDNFDLVHDSTTLGGHAGDTFSFTAVDSTAWLCNANLVTDGANPGTIAVINAG